MYQEKQGNRGGFVASLLLSVGLVSIGLSGCGAAASPGSAEATKKPGKVDTAKSHYVIEGNESYAANPKVRAVLDRGDGHGLFNDGVHRLEIRMIPSPATRTDLNVWLTNLPADMKPGSSIEVTDSIKTPSILVGLGRGLLKGYHEVLSGSIKVEENGPTLSLSFEAELESQSLIDKEREGKRVSVRGRVVEAALPAE